MLCEFMARDYPSLVHHPHCPNRPAPAAPRPDQTDEPGGPGVGGPDPVSAAEPADVARCREYYEEVVPGTTIRRWGRFDRWWVGVLLAEIDRLRGEVPG